MKKIARKDLGIDQKKREKTASTVLGIDPGNEGAFVVTDGVKILEAHHMPVIKEGKNIRVEFPGVLYRLRDFQKRFGADLPVFLEKPVSFGMGTKGAFTYGRGFEALEVALGILELPFTLVEPGKWAKEMHQGISADLKPKAKSLIAVRRLFPKLVDSLPTKPKGGLYDGPVDALLIAGWGLRRLNLTGPTGEWVTAEDFY